MQLIEEPQTLLSKGQGQRFATAIPPAWPAANARPVQKNSPLSPRLLFAPIHHSRYPRSFPPSASAALLVRFQNETARAPVALAGPPSRSVSAEACLK